MSRDFDVDRVLKTTEEGKAEECSKKLMGLLSHQVFASRSEMADWLIQYALGLKAGASVNQAIIELSDARDL